MIDQAGDERLDGNTVFHLIVETHSFFIGPTVINSNRDSDVNFKFFATAVT